LFNASVPSTIDLLLFPESIAKFFLDAWALEAPWVLRRSRSDFWESFNSGNQNIRQASKFLKD
jgi:hypothetical protein